MNYLVWKSGINFPVLLRKLLSTGENILEKNISAADQSRCCLSDEQILRLSEIGVLLEKLYGNARDIEWAIYQVFSLDKRDLYSVH